MILKNLNCTDICRQQFLLFSCRVVSVELREMRCSYCYSYFLVNKSYLLLESKIEGVLHSLLIKLLGFAT